MLCQGSAPLVRLMLCEGGGGPAAAGLQPPTELMAAHAPEPSHDWVHASAPEACMSVPGCKIAVSDHHLAQQHCNT